MNALAKRIKVLEATNGLGQSVYMVEFANRERRKMTGVELAMYAIDRKCNLKSGHTETGIGSNGATPHAFTKYTLIRGNGKMSRLITDCCPIEPIELNRL
jgi:hypothetical protein